MKITSHHKRFITGSILGTGFWYIFFYCQPIAFSFVLIAILLTILIKEWTMIFKYNSLPFWALMPFYPIMPFALLISMNHNPDHRMLLYYLFLTVFSFDTSAYMTGTLFGHNKIIPQISPHKTLEGIIGGFIGSWIMFKFALWNQNTELSNSISIVLVLIICLIAFLGDAFESFLKRRAMIKNSGDYLPGHGGFLDRFDAVMAVAIFFYIFQNSLCQLLLC